MRLHVKKAVELSLGMRLHVKKAVEFEPGNETTCKDDYSALLKPTCMYVMTSS